MTSSAELRHKFLQFFADRDHQIVASSPLVPGNDPTLLFTNAGMVQFKDVFTGKESRSYNRAVTSQRCVRAGGKHNDLENVGYTARHHTFFEMLGNFSFGDYFKQDAIRFAWQFLTEEIGLPKDKLWVTVYQDDDEAADIWLNEIGVDRDRFSRIGDKEGGKKYDSDNFWAMGDTGPCGPCSEIFYDHGADIWGGPPGTPEEDGDRYIEIWNLVFMQYERSADGSMTPLPKPSVDTGMGLERLAAVLQHVHNNYDIDLFQALIKQAAALTGEQDLENKSLRVIADHIRSCAFLIVDGVLPSNEGRGYVLRRIIRRAARHGHQLGCQEPFFHALVAALVEQMGEAYPELVKHQDHVARVLLTEEKRFHETLEQGMKILDEEIAKLESNTIPGDVVFRLYDTYGFPSDLTADVARERELQIDETGFAEAMQQQRERARASSQFKAIDSSLKLNAEQTEFSGYEKKQDRAKIVQILQGEQTIEQLDNADPAMLVLDKTPFYGESGGQVGDSGVIFGEGFRFAVADTQKQSDVFIHIGQLESGSLSLGDTVETEINSERRQAIVLNHSATHLMHAALREVLGEHVAQKGSLVDPDKLRFDFSHFQPMTAEEIRRVEDIVNSQIRENCATQAQLMKQDEALASGAMALFGEKYGDVVRVLKIGSNSVELCGGTHVERAGDIGLFKIVLETGTASGIRRVEAVTGKNAIAWLESTNGQLEQAAELLKSSRDDVPQKIDQLLHRSRQLEKELEQLKAKLAAQAGGDLVSKAIDIEGIQVLAARLDGADNKALRDTLDQLKNKLGKAAVVLASVESGKVKLIAGVTKAESQRLKAGDLVNSVATQVGGKGGGRPDMAQAGGSNPDNLDAALASVSDWVRSQLQAS